MMETVKLTVDNVRNSYLQVKWRKIYWDSYFYEKDEVFQKFINIKTLTNKKDQEIGAY